MNQKRNKTLKNGNVRVVNPQIHPRKKTTLENASFTPGKISSSSKSLNWILREGFLLGSHRRMTRYGLNTRFKIKIRVVRGDHIVWNQGNPNPVKTSLWLKVVHWIGGEAGDPTSGRHDRMPKVSLIVLSREARNPGLVELRAEKRDPFKLCRH